MGESNVSLPSLSNFPPEHREELRKMYLAGFRDAAAKKRNRAAAASGRLDDDGRGRGGAAVDVDVVVVPLDRRGGRIDPGGRTRYPPPPARGAAGQLRPGVQYPAQHRGRWGPRPGACRTSWTTTTT